MGHRERKSVEEGKVRWFSLSNEQILEGLESSLSDSSREVTNIGFENWQDSWDELLETGSHGLRDFKNMLESSNFITEGTGVKCNTSFVLHSLKFELK